jgi:hypothetical protein
MFKIFSTYSWWKKYMKCNIMEDSGTPVLYVGRTVLKGLIVKFVFDGVRVAVVDVNVLKTFTARKRKLACLGRTLLYCLAYSEHSRTNLPVWHSAQLGLLSFPFLQQRVCNQWVYTKQAGVNPIVRSLKANQPGRLAQEITPLQKWSYYRNSAVTFPKSAIVVQSVCNGLLCHSVEKPVVFAPDRPGVEQAELGRRPACSIPLLVRSFTCKQREGR